MAIRMKRATTGPTRGLGIRTRGLRLALAALLPGLVLWAGCAGRGVARVEQGLGELRGELATLGQAQAELRDTQTGLRDAQAALAREMAEVREALQAADARAREGLREQERARTQALASLDAALGRIQEVEARLEAVRGSVVRLEATLDALRDELDRLEAIAPPPQPQTGPPPTTPPEQFYVRALDRYRAGEFGQAVLDFEEFVAKFRSHPLAGNAQYWIGEAFFLHRDFQQAVVEFRKALDLAPRGEKIPDVLLRLGQAYRALKRPERAREVWEQLLRDFPMSEAARRARVALREGRDPDADK